MAISVTCECGKQFKVKDELAGKRGKCAACGQVLSIPTLASSAALEKATPAPLRGCPACREALQPNAVICLHCGHDLRTGKQVPQAMSTAPAAPARPSANVPSSSGLFEFEDAVSSAPSAKVPASSARLWIALIVGGICLAGVVAAVALLTWGREAGNSAIAPQPNPGTQNASPLAKTPPVAVWSNPAKSDSPKKSNTDEAKRESASEAAKAWAKRTLVVTNPQENFNKRVELRNKGDRHKVDDAFKAWREALQKKSGDRPDVLRLGIFFDTFDPIFEDHVFQPKRSDKYVQWIQSLPADAIAAWQELVKQVAEEQIDKTSAIIALIQIDRLFRVAEFNSAEFDLLKARARALPADSIKTLAETLGKGTKREQAFSNLLTQDWLYRGDGSFNQDIFREALGYLTAQQKEAKQ